MKLHQLRYIHEVAKQGLNVSIAADFLHTSQPGVSKQIRLLEAELGMQIFRRNGKRLTGITPYGQEVLSMVSHVLTSLDNIKKVGQEYSHHSQGTLTIATTHTQARYRLPPVVASFIEQYPDVRLSIHQGNPTQVAEQVINGIADVGIATETVTDYKELLCLPYYHWNRCVVTPKGHSLLHNLPLTLEKIASYPIVTYDFAFTGGTLMMHTFASHGLNPNFVLTAIDADVIKTYVLMGLGVGLLASMAYNPERDSELVMLDASHLFAPSTTHIAIRRDTYLRGYVYGFLSLLKPDLDRTSIEEMRHGTSR